MKRALAILLLIAPLRAEPVQVAGMRTEAQRPVEPFYHLFGGQTVQIDLRSLPETETVADLFIVAEPLGVPLQKEIPVKEPLWSLALPDVPQPARFLVRFKTRDRAGWRTVGEIHLFIYPKSMDASLGGPKSALPIPSKPPL